MLFFRYNIDTVVDQNTSLQFLNATQQPSAINDEEFKKQDYYFSTRRVLKILPHPLQF
jgi:hypothetical protein